MSEYHLRNLAEACAPRIAARIDAAIRQVIRDELPEVVQEVLREQHAGGSLSLYVAKSPGRTRGERNAAIRARYNKHNAKTLAAEFGISESLVFKIVALK